MDKSTLEKLRYPTGKFKYDADNLDRVKCLNTIKTHPQKLQLLVSCMTEAELDTAYRPEGWTIRQVVHHLADSHLNAYIRFKWTLTEDEPLIKVYDESAWAELPDSSSPVEISLSLLTALHYRWIVLMRAMSDEDWNRKFEHPEWGNIDLNMMLALYAWHCDHHFGHVELVTEA